MNRTEQEYREALDGLRFSEDAKRRMMDNLMEQKEEKPMKKRNIRPLRMGLIAAALCAAMVLTAGAAAVVARQVSIHFFDSYEEAADASRQSGNRFNGIYGIDTTNLWDYDELEAWNMDFWWNGEHGDAQPEEAEYIVSFGDRETDDVGIIGTGSVRYGQKGQTLLEETAGTAQDGWTARRLFQDDRSGESRLVSKYRADALSGYDGLWNGWDTSWLEAHYTTVTDHTWFEAVEQDGKPWYTGVFGEFRGQGDTVFNVQYGWHSVWTNGEQYHLSEGLDHHEVYTTADGVEATIMTATSHSGKTVFWVSAMTEHGTFSMFGNQVELEELYTILDSLNLSNLLEYEPVG